MKHNGKGMTHVVKPHSLCIQQGLNGSYPGLLNFPRALPLKQSRAVCTLGILCGDPLCLAGSAPPAAEAQAVRWPHTNWKPLRSHSPSGKHFVLFLHCRTSICHFLALPCIPHFKMKTPRWQNRLSCYSTFSIYMNASHMPHSMRNIKQLHSSLFHNSYPAARFPGVAALLDGNRCRRLPARAIRFAENRLKQQTASDHTDSCCLLTGCQHP